MRSQSFQKVKLTQNSEVQHPSPRNNSYRLELKCYFFVSFYFQVLSPFLVFILAVMATYPVHRPAQESIQLKNRSIDCGFFDHN